MEVYNSCYFGRNREMILDLIQEEGGGEIRETEMGREEFLSLLTETFTVGGVTFRTAGTVGDGLGFERNYGGSRSGEVGYLVKGAGALAHWVSADRNYEELLEG